MMKECIPHMHKLDLIKKKNYRFHTVFKAIGKGLNELGGANPKKKQKKNSS